MTIIIKSVAILAQGCHFGSEHDRLCRSVCKGRFAGLLVPYSRFPHCIGPIGRFMSLQRVLAVVSATRTVAGFIENFWEAPYIATTCRRAWEGLSSSVREFRGAYLQGVEHQATAGQHRQDALAVQRYILQELIY